MKRKAPKTRGDAWSDLRNQLATGKPAPLTRPTYLTVKTVKMWPEVFQQRQPAKHASAAHVRHLVSKVVANPLRVLDPLTVWWDGKGWACVDGHHRIAAYRSADAGAFPVQVFEGTADEAMALSARANTRDKMQMSRTEKSNAAWHLVVATSLSKATQADASGTSERLVAYMRQVKSVLQDQGDHNLQDHSWELARQRAAGLVAEGTPWDDDETEKRATALAAKIHKALGTNAGKQVEVFARALEIYNLQLAHGLAEYWQTEVDDEPS